MPEQGPSHHGAAMAGPDAPVRPGAPPWEPAAPPTMPDSAVFVPSGELNIRLAAPPAKTARRERQKPQPRPGRDHWARLDRMPWPLVVILAAQAALSIRLIWSNTAYLDEATYLWAGHVELAHWLHGAATPPYASYFSGAPVIYPPLGALVADAGGLAAARLMSLAFMLGASCLLWGMTRRLFGRWAAYLSAALFAALGPTQFLGAFATYDPMALFLMAAAAWCVVAAQDRDDSSWLLIAGAMLLTLANATKYASLLFDPTIVALGGLTPALGRDRRAPAAAAAPGDSAGRSRLKIALGRAGMIAAITTAADAALLALGGPLYLAGLMSTTVARADGAASPSAILIDSGRWIGLACIPAALAAVLALGRRPRRVEATVVALLAVSAVLAPLSQARIHTATSLSKDVDFGVWFAAAAAGYLIAHLARLDRRRWSAAGAAIAASTAVLVPAAAVGRAQSAAFYQAWPNSSAISSQLGTLARENPGRYLVEDYEVPGYYLENQVRWQDWSDTWYFTWRPPGGRRTLAGLPAYKAAILHHYFTLIVLDFGDTAGTDRSLTADMRAAGDYQPIAELPEESAFGLGQFTVWRYQPPTAAPVHRHRSNRDRQH
jgi:hypothetical protein